MPGLRVPVLRGPVLPVLLLWGSVGLGCAAGAFGRDPFPVSLPDAAALAAGARARADFEAAHPPYPDPALAAGVEEIGRRAVREIRSRTGSGNGGRRARESGGSGGEGSAAGGAGEAEWTFSVTDRSSPEAFVFADRAVFVSRGALAALGGEEALESLFRAAVLRYFGGGFRSSGGDLLEQPVPLEVRSVVEPLSSGPGSGEALTNERATGEGSSAGAAAAGNGAAAPGAGGEEPGAEGAAAERWVSLLDGLALGEPPGRGGARGRDLFLPAAGLRLRAPAGFLFVPGVDGRQVAERDSRAALRIVEHPASERAPGNPSKGTREGDAAGAGSRFEAERRLLQSFDARLREGADAERIEFTERVRVRGFLGVLARLRAGPAAPSAGEPAAGAEDGEEDGERAGEDGTTRGFPVDGASAAGFRDERNTPGGGIVPPGYRALLRTAPGVVEIRFDCDEPTGEPAGDRAGEHPPAACENSFMEMLRSVARLPVAGAPGWLRLRAVSVERRQSAEEALRAFVAAGKSDVPLSVLRELNRGSRGRSLSRGDRLLVAVRDPAGGSGARPQR